MIVLLGSGAVSRMRRLRSVVSSPGIVPIMYSPMRNAEIVVRVVSQTG